MSRLPLLSWREATKVVSKIGFVVERQRGSRIILVKEDRVVPVPRHDQIKRGLLLEIIAEARVNPRRIPRPCEVGALLERSTAAFVFCAVNTKFDACGTGSWKRKRIVW